MGTQTFLPLDEPFLPVPVRTEPRVWLRRVHLFGAPDKPLRNLEFGPGLNVVWAPDAGPEERVGSRIGHGAGKTLLCRLLRHVLGEADLASPNDAAALRAVLPEGFVEAEIIVEGKPWAVRRAFHPTAQSLAVQGDLSALGEADSVPYDEFLAALRGVLGASVATLGQANDPWLAALAWMSRDQERRFGGPLRWRDRVATPSSKLARNPNLERLRAIRSLLRLRDESDLASEQAVAELEQDEKRRIRQLADCEREVAWLSFRLAREGQGDATELAEQPLRLHAVITGLEEQVRALDLPEDHPEIETLREVVEEAVRAEAVASARLEALEAVLQEEDCHVCAAPASQAHASRTGRDPKKAAARGVEEQRKRITRASKAVERARKQLDKAVQKDRARRQKQRDAWASAREQLVRARELERLLHRRTELADELARTQDALATARDDRERALKAHARRMRRVADVFDFVVRRLAGQDVRGRFTITSTGLDAAIHLPDGRRGTSPALRVLETLALDLTALALACENESDLPGLWIHDSPREADLARSHYDALYRLAGWLADSTSTPGFQYIVTTTTRPPSSVAFRTVRLGGASHEDLLLRRALRC